MENTERNPTDEIEKYKIIRERWDREDSLLIERTGVFLTTNSILYAALGFHAQNLPFQIGVAVIGFALSTLWLTTSWHSTNVIRELYQLCKDDMPYGLEKIYDLI